MLVRLEFASLDGKHVMTVARGPLHEALPTFIQQAGWSALLRQQPAPARVDPASEGAGTSSSTSGTVEDSSPVRQRHRAALAVPMPPCQYKLVEELLLLQPTAGR